MTYKKVIQSPCPLQIYYEKDEMCVGSSRTICSCSHLLSALSCSHPVAVRPQGQTSDVLLKAHSSTQENGQLEALSISQNAHTTPANSD